MTLTAEQLEIRRTGLTATDMAKILGLSPYGSAIDVLMDKQGTPTPFVMHDRVKWGDILEGPIRDDYAERHGVTVLTGDEIGTLRHPDPDLAWLMATPDGLVEPDRAEVIRGKAERRILWGWEGKTHTGWLSHLYGEPGTDDVPAWELIQCQVNLIVARAKFGDHITRWDLTPFMDGLPSDYTITHDEELAQMIIEAGRVFWFDHFLGGKPLAPDGSDHFSAHLARKFPKNTEELIDPGHDARNTIMALRGLRDEIKGLEADEEKQVQILKELIGENSGIQWLGAAENSKGKLVEKIRKITWRRSSDSTKTDWRAAYEALVEATVGKSHELATLCATKNTKPKPGSRRFVVPRSWSK
jgi:predicted phage-related endonuclease